MSLANDVVDEMIGAQNQPTQTPTQKRPEWSELPWNVPSSAANLASGLYQTVRHPIATAKNALAMTQGGVVNAMPDAYINWLNKVQPSLAAKREEVSQVGDAVGQYAKNRFGGMENIRNTVITDPVGAAADLSLLLSGGAGALKTASHLPKMQALVKPAQVMTEAASLTNPMNLAAEGIVAGSKGVANIIGGFTGNGGAPLQEAARAGMSGGKDAKAFRDNFSGKVNYGDVIDQAKQSLTAMKIDKNKQYRSGMAEVSNDKTVLDFTGISKTAREAVSSNRFNGVPKDPYADKILIKMQKEINQWQRMNPKYHTPEGFDALKQRLDSMVEGIPFEQKTARMLAAELPRSVKADIVKQAPVYADVMSDYSTAAEQIKELERALSLGEKASIDTALRRLQSVMRNNVNTNFGNRIDLVKVLESKGGNSLLPALAGQALNAPSPRGIQGATRGGIGMGGYYFGGIPGAVAAYAASSPKLTGGLAYMSGAATRPMKFMSDKGVDPALLANIMAHQGLLDQSSSKP